MLLVDHALCADCGGCVGTCHVDCITIERPTGAPPPAEVHVRIGAQCDACNVCVLICPTGALRTEAPLVDWRR